MELNNYFVGQIEILLFDTDSLKFITSLLQTLTL